jgi:hypothetical protein
LHWTGSGYRVHTGVCCSVDALLISLLLLLLCFFLFFIFFVFFFFFFFFSFFPSSHQAVLGHLDESIIAGLQGKETAQQRRGW